MGCPPDPCGEPADALAYQARRPSPRGSTVIPVQLHGAASGQRGMHHRPGPSAVHRARRESAPWLPVTPTVYHVHLALPERRRPADRQGHGLRASVIVPVVVETLSVGQEADSGAPQPCQPPSPTMSAGRGHALEGPHCDRSRGPRRPARLAQGDRTGDRLIVMLETPRRLAEPWRWSGRCRRLHGSAAGPRWACRCPRNRRRQRLHRQGRLGVSLIAITVVATI